MPMTTSREPAASPMHHAVTRSGAVLQRKCACGKHTGGSGECDECRKKAQSLHRKVSTDHVSIATGDHVSGEVIRGVLDRSGEPLDPKSRELFEPRFGRDFSQVRLHTDAAASESALAVGASAYPVGRHIAFRSGEYAPDTKPGQHLLAHELAHVAQQRSQDVSPSAALEISDPSDSAEHEAERVADSMVDGIAHAQSEPGPAHTTHAAAGVARLVSPRQTSCAPNANGAPADPVADLTAMDELAGGLCAGMGTLLAIAGALTQQGFRNPAGGVDQAYRNTFGVPVAQGRGFLNRLSGVVRPTLDAALGDEMQLLSLRYDLLTRFFSQPIAYRCNATAFGGCPVTAATCVAGDAASCEGVSAIFVCPTFWGFNRRQQAGVAIHEAAHINWGNVDHGARGSGGNFRHAECYAALPAQIFGIALPPTGAPCVAPGP